MFKKHYKMQDHSVHPDLNPQEFAYFAMFAAKNA